MAHRGDHEKLLFLDGLWDIREADTALGSSVVTST
jgi:hypothetical protein